MRDAIWRWVCRNVSENTRLPRMLMLIRWLLYPLDTAYWKLSEGRGYHVETCTWKIRGREYTDGFFRALERADGEVYRIRNSGGACSFERVREKEVNAWAVEVLDEDGHRFADILRTEEAASARLHALGGTRLVPLEGFDWDDATTPFCVSTPSHGGLCHD